ncbi:MerR family transcriptional regulator [Levilactobacillus spicheri]
MLKENFAKFMKKMPLDEMVLGIGDVARVTGVSQSQLRYWERKGYIQTSELADGGNRKFTYKTALQVKQIKMLLDEGYTLVSAVARARKRGVYAETLRSFFEERFNAITVDDDQHEATIDLGVFDPDPSQHLITYRRADQWHFRLGPAE